MRTTKWTEFSFILKPSPFGGIGVFATHAIKQGTEIFARRFEPRIIKVSAIPEDFLKYCIYVNDDEVICPERFDRMEIGWYINHSNDPNIAQMPITHHTTSTTMDAFKYGFVYAVKDINADDEILCDYNMLNEPEHLREDYYGAISVTAS